ncbi:AMP-binding protein [Streptomyces hygroscopicus]|uniref:AMP-binding protein n=1 Tax=Streptomyces hygroscopicus TaxID=1912 RepID=UPI002240CCB5|nr:AMP-binding protein [Streptomyces hygroscopicus]
METSSIYGPPTQPRTIHDAFYRVAAQHPQRVAVRTATDSITYAELAADSRRIAAQLTSRGIGLGHVVPVVARRSVELPAVLLGILATGAAYGMLDVRWPPRRLQRFLRRMDAPVAVADSAGLVGLTGSGTRPLTVDELHHTPAEDGPLPQVAPEACATVFWTSGSTGTPKAVLSPHQATTRLFTTPPYLDYGNAPVMIHAAAVAWDAFTLELWGMLLLGGTLIVHTADVLLPGDLRSYIRDLGATHLFLTPSLADVIVAGDIDCVAGLRCLMVGGDKPTPATCQKLYAAYPAMELVNGYGPVESCVFATTHPITPADAHAPQPIPAGGPVPGTGVHIVADGCVLPRGQVGEVALSGSGLALGYLDEPELTDAAFRTLTVDGRQCRVYLTGDHGHIDDRGTLHFAGRRDAQIKVAGHRIEPAEIETAALSLGSGRAVALPLPDGAGNPRLVLFAEPPAPGLTETELHVRLRETLPAYMVPARVHVVPEMPLLDNTKIDKRALAERYGYPAQPPRKDH